MFSVAVLKPGKLVFVQIPRPVPGPYEVLIRTEAACICNATDRKLVDGCFPRVEHYPLLLGHESAGIVEEVGGKVKNFKVGERVIGGLLLNSTDAAYSAGWGGFCEYTLAGDHQAMLVDGVADQQHGYAEVLGRCVSEIIFLTFRGNTGIPVSKLGHPDWFAVFSGIINIS